VVAKRILLVACLAAFGGCTVDKQTAPDISGPSGLGLSIDVKATPDVVVRDGISTSTIEVLMRDAEGRPVADRTVFFGTQINLGSVSSQSAKTNSSGKATVTYTAPPVGNDTTTTITVTPVGDNSQNTWGRTVAIRLVRPPA
jgi:Bacterial Ig-like domain (group 1)